MSAVDGYFIDTWTWLANRGACDAVGGAEYHRVYREWCAADKPDNLIAFIGDRANLTPAQFERLPH